MFTYAKEDLEIFSVDIEKKVQNYRKTLIQHALEKQYIADQLNTEVSEEAIATYYQQEVIHFVLNEDILRVLYVKVLRRTSGINAFRATLRRHPLGEASAIREYCAQNPPLCRISDTTWMPKRRILALLPSVRRSSVDQRLGRARYIETQDETYTYMLHVLEYKAAGERPPLTYIRPDIVHNILSKRRKDLLRKFREDIWRKAKRDDAYQIHL